MTTAEALRLAIKTLESIVENAYSFDATQSERYAISKLRNLLNAI